MLSFSSSVIHGKIRCLRCSGKWISSYLKMFMKLFRNNVLIWFGSLIQVPFSILMASTLLLLLRIIVDKWKNLEFLSPILSHNSLDFCRQITSLRRSHSESSAGGHFPLARFLATGVYLDLLYFPE